MKKLFLLKMLIPFLILLFLSIGSAHATRILYEANDLIDTTPGEDLWEYSYFVSDFPFPAFYGFTILFDPNLYSDLQDPPPFVNADWDPIVLQPDLALPDVGTYDAQALVDNPSTADPFSVNFVWLGAGSPGSQPFKIYDNFFKVIDTGQTAPVPEPTTLLLLSCGLLGMAGLRRKFKR